MTIIANLTNPGADPIDGDMMEYRYLSGSIERKAYYAPVEPEPYVAPVPSAVSMAQARLALLAAGYLSTIDAFIAAMPGAQGTAARIEWEYSGQVQRNRPLVAAMGQVLGLNDAALDQLFIAAATF